MMGKTKILSSIYGNYNFRFVKLRPSRNFLLDPKTYSTIWNIIIDKILQSVRNQKLYVVLTLNIFIMAKRELYSLILDKIKNGEYEVIYEKQYPAGKIIVNNIESEFSEHKYVLSVKPDDLKFLVEKLNDKDAMELLVAKHEICLDDISKIIDYGVNDISHYLNYCVYFNDIHIGLNIEMYNGDIAKIEDIFIELQNIKDLNVLFKGA